jgi:hypothetical protein
MLVPLLGNAQIVFSERETMIGMNAQNYTEGWKSGWESAYHSLGRTAPNAPVHRNSPPRRNGDTSTEVERGYRHGLLEAYQKMQK